MVVELQRRLAAEALYSAGIDGGFGPMTDAALKLFQQAKGISPTGATDELTWMHLNDWPRPALQVAGRHIMV
ncbi:peptidoglycan-binding domain-containing protein, partial [Staphylococcus aureus]